MSNEFITPEHQSIIIGNSKYFNSFQSPFVFGCEKKKDFRILITNFKKYAGYMGYDIEYTFINSIVPCNLTDKLTKNHLVFYTYKEAFEKLYKNSIKDHAEGLCSYFVLKINNIFYCAILLF